MVPVLCLQDNRKYLKQPLPGVFLVVLDQQEFRYIFYPKLHVILAQRQKLLRLISYCDFLVIKRLQTLASRSECRYVTKHISKRASQCALKHTKRRAHEMHWFVSKSQPQLAQGQRLSVNNSETIRYRNSVLRYVVVLSETNILIPHMSRNDLVIPVISNKRKGNTLKVWNAKQPSGIKICIQ